MILQILCIVFISASVSQLLDHNSACDTEFRSTVIRYQISSDRIGIKDRNPLHYQRPLKIIVSTVHTKALYEIKSKIIVMLYNIEIHTIPSYFCLMIFNGFLRVLGKRVVNLHMPVEGQVISCKIAAQSQDFERIPKHDISDLRIWS